MAASSAIVQNDRTRNIFMWLFVAAFLYGFIALGMQETDPSAEKQAVEDAVQIAQGNHMVGIVSYAHYPNGPSYILLPFVAANPVLAGYTFLRFVPLLVSALALSALFATLIRMAESREMRWWLFAAFAVLLVQPGLSGWFGALHKQAYEMALVMGISWVGLRTRDARGILFALGFVAGWIGYDFLIAQVGVMFLVRCMYFADPAQNLSQDNLRRVFPEALAGALGAFLAIVAHLLQNTLFFGSLNEAWNDLVGSAMVRIYLDHGPILSQGYLQEIQQAIESHAPKGGVFKPAETWVGALVKDFLVRFGLVDSRFFISITMFHRFLVAYISPVPVATLFLVGVVVLRRDLHRRGISGKGMRILVINAALYLLAAATASVGWFFVMKYHAMFHYHFLPRLYFVPVFILLIFMVRASMVSALTTGEPR